MRQLDQSVERLHSEACSLRSHLLFLAASLLCAASAGHRQPLGRAFQGFTSACDMRRSSLGVDCLLRSRLSSLAAALLQPIRKKGPPSGKHRLFFLTGIFFIARSVRSVGVVWCSIEEGSIQGDTPGTVALFLSRLCKGVFRSWRLTQRYGTRNGREV